MQEALDLGEHLPLSAQPYTQVQVTDLFQISTLCRGRHSLDKDLPTLSWCFGSICVVLCWKVSERTVKTLGLGVIEATD